MEEETKEPAMILLDFSAPGIRDQVKDLCSSLPASYPHLEGLHFCKEWLEGNETFVFSTSGSTGKEKEQVVTKGQIVASVTATASFFGLQTGDAVFICLPTKYTGGKMMLARALHVGMKAYLVLPRQDPFDMFPKGKLMALVSFIPSQMGCLLQREDASSILSSLSHVLLGGAAVSPELREKINTFSSPIVYETFGMTETLSHVALRKLSFPAHDLFEALSGIQLGVDDRNCLQIKGAVTEYTWLSTNDVVDLKDSTHFRWMGRIDHVINSGGVKIQPEKVEELIRPLLRENGFFGEFMVMGIPDEVLGSKLILCIEDEMEDKEKIVHLLKQRVPLYHAPRQVMVLDSLPRTASGKLKRGLDI